MYSEEPSVTEGVVDYTMNMSQPFVTEGIIDYTRNLGRRLICPSSTRPLFEGENHFPCHNFTGPGTQIMKRIKRGDKPVDAVDACSMDHDIYYQNIANTPNIDPLIAAENVMEADQILLRCIANIPNSNKLTLQHAAKYIAQEVIQGKAYLESKGIISPLYLIK